MVIAKRAFRKDTGRQYAHFVQSFDPKDPVSPSLAYEIGQQFIRRYEKWNDFQIVMAVHTNEPQMNIHYIVNSVSHKDGRKWQSSPEDLKRMRELSDALCREHGLSVIEKGRAGHKSYGEHTHAASWKQQLAKDIAAHLALSHSRADFLHRMDALGIEVDVGKKSILFTVPSGVYGLKEPGKCSNFKLLSYGDFSTENIRATWQCNRQLADIGRSDMQLLQEVLLDLGRLHFPEEPDRYQNMYFHDVDFDGLTKQEIEIALARKALDALLEQARKVNERAAAEARQAGLLLSSVASIFEEVLHWQEQQETPYMDFTFEEESEYEL